MRWFENLNGDVPGLEAGAIVDADVAAEGLPQIDRPIDASPHDHINTIIRCNLLLEWKRERERDEPEGLREDEEAGEREGVDGVAEEEAVAEGEVAGDGGGRRVERVEEALEEGGGVGGGGGGGVGPREGVLGEEDVARVEAERGGLVGLQRGRTAASRGTPASGSAAAAPAPAAAAGAPPPDTAAARRCRATPSPENEGDLGGSLSRAVESRLVVVQFAG